MRSCRGRGGGNGSSRHGQLSHGRLRRSQQRSLQRAGRGAGDPLAGRREPHRAPAADPPAPNGDGDQHRCPLPAGADAVVPVENTRRAGSRVQILTAPVVGAYIRRRGHDVRRGARVASAGTRLRSVDVGVCAAAGRAHVSVAVRPRVALLSSGDELVRPGSTPLPHQVTDVNSSMLAAAVREAGGCVTHTGVIADDRAAVLRALSRASQAADLIVSSAGVSWVATTTSASVSPCWARSMSGRWRCGRASRW